MNFNHIRLGLALLWGTVAVLLLGRDVLAPGVFDRFDQNYLNTGLALAGLLAAYNLVRWYLDFRKTRRRAGPPNPLAKRPANGHGGEYHPEFDFDKR